MNLKNAWPKKKKFNWTEDLLSEIRASFRETHPSPIPIKDEELNNSIDHVILSLMHADPE